MVWLWPQWQSGLLKKNAHDALEADQQAIRLILWSASSASWAFFFSRPLCHCGHSQTIPPKAIRQPISVQAIRLILSPDPKAPALAYQRMRVNQAHNALYNSAGRSATAATARPSRRRRSGSRSACRSAGR
jgi:uncharacterized membrane protein YccC